MATNVKNIFKYVVTFFAGGILGSMATGAAIKQRLRMMQANLSGMPPGAAPGMPAGMMPMIPPEEAMKQLMENPEMVKQILNDPTVPPEAKSLLKEFQSNPKLMEEMMHNLKAMNTGGVPYNAAPNSPLPSMTNPLASTTAQPASLTPPVYQPTPVAPINASTLKL